MGPQLIALCDRGSIRTTNEAVVAGFPVAVSVMDIHTVGAGGVASLRVLMKAALYVLDQNQRERILDQLVMVVQSYRL